MEPAREDTRPTIVEVSCFRTSYYSFWTFARKTAIFACGPLKVSDEPLKVHDGLAKVRRRPLLVRDGLDLVGDEPLLIHDGLAKVSDGLCLVRDEPLKVCGRPSKVNDELGKENRQTNGLRLAGLAVLCPPNAWICKRRRARSDAPYPDCL